MSGKRNYRFGVTLGALTGLLWGPVESLPTILPFWLTYLIHGNSNDLSVIQIPILVKAGNSAFGFAIVGLLMGAGFVKFMNRIPTKRITSKAILFFIAVGLIVVSALAILENNLGMSLMIDLAILPLWGTTFGFLYDRWTAHRTSSDTSTNQTTPNAE